jgi:ferrochelatase
MAADSKRIGVVLFQLGGPDSLETVEPFLYNLFCDPDIIDFPLGGIFRRPLAWWIARLRSRHVAEAYAEIGGRSPIRVLTERQARALEQALAPHADARVVIAMRYWHPFTEEAVSELDAAGVEEVVLLPLYPQFSFATTGSSLREWRRVWKRRPQPVHIVEEFHDHPLYTRAVAERIRRSLSHFDRPDDVHLVFSAHGLPVSFIERGDPYQQQVEATVRLVMTHGGWPNPHTLCYQSKVGRQKWLEPSLDQTVERLAAAGTRAVLVVPISFVSEHIETLHEINIETREEALKLGIEQFEMAPAVGDAPEFIAALADLVLRARKGGARAASRAVAAASR